MRVTDSFCGFLWEARRGNVRADPQQIPFISARTFPLVSSGVSDGRGVGAGVEEVCTLAGWPSSELEQPSAHRLCSSPFRRVQ